MKKSIRVILICFFSAMLLFSAWKLISILLTYREGRDSYTSLEQYVTPAPPAAEEPENKADKPVTVLPVQPSADAEAEEPEPCPIAVDFEELAQINPDVVGWIYIEDTDIHYPVVQGADNDYYLMHLFDGTYHSSGCIFLDAQNAVDLSDRHSIIYGHNMRDSSMFAGLVEYQSQTYYEAHPVVWYLTPTHEYAIRLFSGYVSDTRSSAWQKTFEEEGSFEAWVAEIAGKSCFEPETIPEELDKVVTLSTCTYDFDTAKFVLHGYIESCRAYE